MGPVLAEGGRRGPSRSRSPRQIADSDEVRDVVTGLEQQYDAFHTQAANLLADDEPLPSGEEIGAQFEQFLARLEGPRGLSRVPASVEELLASSTSR